MQRFFPAWLVLACSLTGCSDVQVSTEQDPKADFSALWSYAWFEPTNNEAPDPELSEIARRRIKNCIQDELEARGYSWAPVERADMLIKWVAVAGGSVDLPPVGVRFGVEDRPTRGAGAAPPNLTEGSLIIDVISNKAPRKVIWRSVAEATVNRSLPDEERQARIQQAVAKTFSSFPTHKPK